MARLQMGDQHLAGIRPDLESDGDSFPGGFYPKDLGHLVLYDLNLSGIESHFGCWETEDSEIILGFNRKDNREEIFTVPW